MNKIENFALSNEVRYERIFRSLNSFVWFADQYDYSVQQILISRYSADDLTSFQIVYDLCSHEINDHQRSVGISRIAVLKIDLRGGKHYQITDALKQSSSRYYFWRFILRAVNIFNVSYFNMWWILAIIKFMMKGINIKSRFLFDVELRGHFDWYCNEKFCIQSVSFESYDFTFSSNILGHTLRNFRVYIVPNNGSSIFASQVNKIICFIFVNWVEVKVDMRMLWSFILPWT